MKLTARVIVFIILFSALSFAETWTGTLVDSGCWEAAERNVNPGDTETSVDRDQNREIRYCSPRAKTKSFRVVQHDGASFPLDSAGNAKAADLVRVNSRKSTLFVAVAGALTGKNIIAVDSISVEK